MFRFRGDRAREEARRFAPGLALLVLVGGVARLVADAVPGANHLLLAIVAGVVLANAVGVPEWAEPGVATHGLLLGAGIVLMGARISLAAVVDAGLQLLVLVLAVVAFTLVLTELLARTAFGLRGSLASLLAAGLSICGVSAVVAVAGGIRAEGEDVTYVVATVLLVDAVTLFLYPLAGGLLDLSARTFGLWAGVSMLSTGPVAAAGFAYADVAGQWAVVTKLTRNVLIGVVVVVYSVCYLRPSASDVRGSLRQLWVTFPKFVLGFVAMAVVANAGLLSEARISHLTNAYRWCFLFAFAGLGLDVRLSKLRAAGLRPASVAFLTLCIASAVALAAVTVLFG
ncbi:YeiH family protein [Salinirarus marinus]|uniref:YeiH family protein n=1 Tax=Salinirarus marinus TaxID=3068310 RepID=UPI003C6C90FC